MSLALLFASALIVSCTVFLVGIRRRFFAFSFASIFLILQVIVPIIHLLVVGFSVEHPESKHGPISDVVYYDYYAIQVFLFSLLLLMLNVGGSVRSSRRAVFKVFNFFEVVPRIKFYFALALLLGVAIYLKAIGLSELSFQSFMRVVFSPRMSMYDNPEFSQLFKNISFYLLSLIATSAFYFTCRIKDAMGLVVLVLIAVVVVTLIAKGRQWIILLMSGVFASLYMYHKLSYRYMLFFGGGVLCFLVVWQALRANVFSESGLAFFDIEYSQFLIKGDLSYFYIASLEAIRAFLEEGVHYLGNFYRNLTFIVVPSEFTFGLKQPDLSILFAESFISSTTARDGNYPPGFIGMMVLNFGFWGWVLIGLPILLFIRILDAGGLSAQVFVPISACFIYAVLQLMRGTLGGVYIMVFNLLFVLLCFYMSRFWRAIK